MTIGVPTAKVSRDDRPPPTGKGSSTTSANSNKLENSLDSTLASDTGPFPSQSGYRRSCNIYELETSGEHRHCTSCRWSAALNKIVFALLGTPHARSVQKRTKKSEPGSRRSKSRLRQKHFFSIQRYRNRRAEACTRLSIDRSAPILLLTDGRKLLVLVLHRRQRQSSTSVAPGPPSSMPPLP